MGENDVGMVKEPIHEQERFRGVQSASKTKERRAHQGGVSEEVSKKKRKSDSPWVKKSYGWECRECGRLELMHDKECVYGK